MDVMLVVVAQTLKVLACVCQLNLYVVYLGVFVVAGMLIDSLAFHTQSLSGSGYCCYSCLGSLFFAFAPDLQLQPLSLNSHTHSNTHIHTL